MPIVLGGGRMVPGFEEQLVGLKAGDAKSIDIKFPSDYPTAQLAGRAASVSRSSATRSPSSNCRRSTR